MTSYSEWTTAVDGITNGQYFHVYHEAGGRLDSDTFNQCASALTEFLLPAYVWGEGSREEAWQRYVAYLNHRCLSEDTGIAIFAAIDKLTPLT